MAWIEELRGRRERALELLGASYAAGLLSTDTLEQRVGLALVAQRGAELERAVWDLPRSASVLASVVDAVRWPAPDPPALRIGQPCQAELWLEDGRRGRWLLGRSRCADVVIAESSVSRRHAEVTMRGGRWAVRDLGSTNGTWCNGERVTAAALERGDVLHFGAVAATVR